jgi:polar amino acid transport system substrate-binding protein
VLQEVEDKIINQETKIEKIDLDENKKDELFAQLKEAVKTKRAKNTKPILEEFEKYNLNDEDKELYNKIKSLVKKFKFKEAGELL